MNNAKMWLVVSPTIGVPIFLGAVAVGSFAVHTAILTNTSWVSDFLKGNPMGSGDKMSSVVVPEQSNTAKVSYALPLANGGTEVTLIMPDGTETKAILKRDEIMASLASPPRIAD